MGNEMFGIKMTESTKQWSSESVQPITARGLVSVEQLEQSIIFGKTLAAAVRHNKPLIFGPVSIFRSTDPAEFVLDRRVCSFSSCGCKRNPKCRHERQLETTPLLHSTPQGWVCMIVGLTPRHEPPHPHPQPQFSEAETSAAIFGAQSGAVTNDHRDKPKLFGTFFLFFYLWAPVGHKGIPAMTTMWVDPACGMDSWHSRLLTSHRPEVGSDLEPIRGFFYAAFRTFGGQLV